MSDKPIREYDRFILRLPDGMRERLQSRAQASGRSMNAEAVAILEQALSDPSEAQIEALAREGLNLLARESSHEADLRMTQARLQALRAELGAVLGPASGSADPLDYTLRVHLRRNMGERASRKGESDDTPPALKGLQR